MEDFSRIEHMSCGAFLSVLAAAEKDRERRRILDKAIREVFRKSWAYKRKSRRYIDMGMLVDDLFDTARFVRNAAENSIRELESVEETAPLEPLEPEGLSKVLPLFTKASEAREQHNVPLAERLARQIIPVSSELIATAGGNIEMEIIATKMITAGLFEHYTWLLHQRLRQNDLEMALSHSYACSSLMNFVSVEKEAIESLFALQTLVLLLINRTEEALETIREVPAFGEVSANQLLALTAALVETDRSKEASKLVEKYPERAEGLLDSYLSYSNDAYNRGRRKLAVDLLSFVLVQFKNRTDKTMEQIARRLFKMTRLEPEYLGKDCLPVLKSILGEDAQDKTDSRIPSLKKFLPSPIPSDNDEISQFAGDWSLLSLSSDYVLAWSTPLQSIWKEILPQDVIEGALPEALSFYLTSGTLEKISARTRNAKERYRGTVKIKDPVLRVSMKSPWD